jgi:hypothetical protein
MDPGNMDKKALIDAATKRIFSLGPRDLASALAYENMRYGLGKMIYASGDLEAFCVFGPDATITRNVGRWDSGFGYGAIIRWSDKGIYFPELRPNACGMVLARIDEMPSKEDVIDGISRMSDSEISLDGVRIRPDFGHGNHFFEFYSVLESSPDVEEHLSKEGNYVLLHGSAPEKKEEFYEETHETESLDTPLGPVSVLDGAAGKNYYKKWERLKDFSMRRRELLLKEILGEFKVVSNLVHQGLFARNEVRLGCYDTMQKNNGKGGLLYPVALRWDLPLYVFKGRENLSEEVIARVGFKERAESLGIMDQLKGVNILPHGGGYKVDVEYTKISVVDSGKGRHFILKGAKPASSVSEMIETSQRGVSGFGEMVIMNPRELPYDYRGMSVVEKTMEYGLGSPVAKLQPLMTFKV